MIDIPTKEVQRAEKQLWSANENAEAAKAYVRAAKRRLGIARYGELRLDENAGGFEPISAETCALLATVGIATYAQLIGYGIEELKELLNPHEKSAHEVVGHLAILDIPMERQSPPPHNDSLDVLEVWVDEPYSELLRVLMDHQLKTLLLEVPPSLRNGLLAWIRSRHLRLEIIEPILGSPQMFHLTKQ